MLPWRLGRACAIAGGLVGVVVAIFASVAPVGPWGAAAWSRALVVPLALLLAAALALRPRAGPSALGRVGWAVLVAGLVLLLVASATAWRGPFDLGWSATLAASLGALATGAAAGRRRALPRAAWYALALAPVAAVIARAALHEATAAGAAALGVVLLVVGVSTLD